MIIEIVYMRIRVEILLMFSVNQPESEREVPT